MDKALAIFSLALALGLCLAGTKLAPASSPESARTQPAASAAAIIRVGKLVYGQGAETACYSTRFLREIARQTRIQVDRDFVPLTLTAPDLREHPFAVLSGQGAFTWSTAEAEALRDYLQSGGFLVASAGCSNKPWADSFLAAIERLFPQSKLENLPPEHALFHTLYDLPGLVSRQATGQPAPLLGLTIQGRLALIFSPQGLSDSAEAGGDCCCCGGDEIRDAYRLNTNALAYALLH